jgi:hypothetical protein
MNITPTTMPIIKSHHSYSDHHGESQLTLDHGEGHPIPVVDSVSFHGFDLPPSNMDEVLSTAQHSEVSGTQEQQELVSAAHHCKKTMCIPPMLVVLLIGNEEM